MNSSPSDQVPLRNRLLLALPDKEYELLAAHLQLVPLSLSEVLCEAGTSFKYAYFVNRGIVSLLSSTLGGETVEIGMVGSEGMVGLPALLNDGSMPYRTVVQLAGEAFRVKMDVLKDIFSRCGPLHDLLIGYLHPLITQFTQSGLCNHYHTIHERLCRWLLILHDHAETNTVELTQELIAHMLGVHRTGVSLAAGELQASGLIRYSRGKITILDRDSIEVASCECYRVVKDGYDQFFKK